MVHQMIARHSRQPGGESPLRRIKRAQGLEYLDEDFLSKVFRFRWTARETITQVKNLAVVSLEQGFPCRVFAREAPLHQLRVVFHSASPQPAPRNRREHAVRP